MHLQSQPDSKKETHLSYWGATGRRFSLPGTEFEKRLSPTKEGKEIETSCLPEVLTEKQEEKKKRAPTSNSALSAAHGREKDTKY